MRQFRQVNVFSADPLGGNPLAVVHTAEGLSDAQMGALARWTNLSETTFLLRPTDPDADYYVRIFTPTGELELTRFRGHPIVWGKGRSTMPKSHRPYAPEFRQRIVELVHKGRTPEELARQFEPSAQAIRNWLKQAALDAGERTDGLTTEERDELRRLRREVRQLREERAILSKAAAWFARETNTIPSKDSSS